MSSTKTPAKAGTPISIGFDIGNQGVAVSVNDKGSSAKPVRMGGLLSILNAVWQAVTGEIFIGDKARNRASLEPKKYVESYKRLLPDHADEQIGESGLTPRACLRAVWGTIATALKKSSKTLAEAIDQGTALITVTVPSCFPEWAKKVYRDVAKEIGLYVTSFITEPIAAATHIRSIHPERFKDGDLILVVDVGSSTTDCELLKYDSGKFEQTLPSDGLRIGGTDFTGRAYCHLCETTGRIELVKCYTPGVGFDFSSSDLSPQQLITAMAIQNAAEKLKHELAHAESAEIYADLPGAGTAEFAIDQAMAQSLWDTLVKEVCSFLTSYVDKAPARPALLIAVGGGSNVPELVDRLALASGMNIDDVLFIPDSVNVIANGAAEAGATEALNATILSHGLGVMVKDPDTKEDVGVVLAPEGQRISLDGFRVESDQFYVEPRGGNAEIELRCIEVHSGIVPNNQHGRLTVPASNASLLGQSWVSFSGLGRGRQRLSLQLHYKDKNAMFAIHPVGSDVEPQRISLLDDSVPPERQSSPLHLQLLLDISTSMEGNLDGVKDGLVSLIPELLANGITVSLIAFGSKAKTLVSNSTSEKELSEAIAQLKVSGTTNLSDALRHAADLVTPEHENIVFLYTDGMPNSASDSIEAARSLKLQVDRVATFGIGLIADHDLLRTEIATSRDDHFEGVTTDIPIAISSVVDLYLFDKQPVSEVTA